MIGVDDAWDDVGLGSGLSLAWIELKVMLVLVIGFCVGYWC